MGCHHGVLDHQIEIDARNVFVKMIGKLFLDISPHDVFICEGKLLQDRRHHVELTVEVILVELTVVFDQKGFLLTQSIKCMHTGCYVLIDMIAFFH